MATVTTHTLNGTNGTHASGIEVTLVNIDSGSTLFATKVDAGGRLAETVDISAMSPTDRYELTIYAGEFWDTQGATHTQRVDEIVLRFKMPVPDGRYHMPVILSPNSYSMWTSIPE